MKATTKICANGFAIPAARGTVTRLDRPTGRIISAPSANNNQNGVVPLGAGCAADGCGAVIVPSTLKAARAGQRDPGALNEWLTMIRARHGLSRRLFPRCDTGSGLDGDPGRTQCGNLGVVVAGFAQ